MNVVALDFETATGHRNSACAVALVTVRNEKIVEEYETLIQPPDNYFWRRFTQEIHGISWLDTLKTHPASLICTFGTHSGTCKIGIPQKGRLCISFNNHSLLALEGRFAPSGNQCHTRIVPI